MFHRWINLGKDINVYNVATKESHICWRKHDFIFVMENAYVFIII